MISRVVTVLGNSGGGCGDARLADERVAGFIAVAQAASGRFIAERAVARLGFCCFQLLTLTLGATFLEQQNVNCD